jgi:hypothetical protein
MRKARRVALACALATLVPAATADAARTLTVERAQARAEQTAQRRAAREPAIASWELSRPFRYASTKIVFVWDAEYADGRACAGMLVVRLASRRSGRTIGYIRNEECG